MENKSITTFEAIAHLVILSIAGIVLSSNKIIIQSCKTSSVLNSIYITFLTFVFSFILCLLHKNFEGKTILDVSDFIGGKFLKNIIGLIFILYITFRISIFLRIISTTIQNAYYPMTHILFIIAFFCLATSIICNFKSTNLFKTNSFIFIIIYSSIFFIFIGNAKNYNFENIYPLLGTGGKTTFFYGISNIFSFCSIAYLFFLPPKLKDSKKFTKVALLSIILSGAFLILCTANTLFLYSDTLTNSDIFPLYLSVRYIEFGPFFQRLDAIFLFLCVIGFISVLCFNTFILTSIIKDITNISDDKPLILPCLFSIFDLSLIIRENYSLNFLENTVSKIIYIITAFIVPFIILVIANLKKKITGNNN